MPSRITLSVVAGPLTGQKFLLDERTTTILGRGAGCSPRLPDDADHRTISRHHCLLDVNPPDIRVRDFGSLNGTYVNGMKIGQREEHQSPHDVSDARFPEYDLKDGDRVQLGKTVLEVGVHVPITCGGCAAELPNSTPAAPTGGYLCERCQVSIVVPATDRMPAPSLTSCAQCGRDLSEEAATNRQGLLLCRVCKQDPMQLLKKLLRQANTGHKDLLAIQGYSIERELGRGGMGAVYLARHDRTGESVALKVMLPEVALDERAKDMFLRETVNTKALRHKHVVELREAGCSNATFFFTLEFCDGGSVDRLMVQRGGRLPVDEALPIVLEALDGLEYAHHAEIPHVRLADGRTVKGKGLVHRDLSPHNLFLSLSNGARSTKVGDYGLAKAFDTAGLSGQTRSGSSAGKPHFMPRQQVVNYKYATPDVDVWAMAATLYCMLTGFVPRDFHARQDPWAIVLSTAPVPIRQRTANLPKRLSEVIDHALIDNPDIKVKTAAQLKKMLENAL